MTAENFAYWLQGYNEISGGKAPTTKQWKVIQDHLALVFNKITPNRNVSGEVPVITRGIVKDGDDIKFCTHRDSPFGGFPGVRNCGDAKITFDPPIYEQLMSASC